MILRHAQACLRTAARRPLTLLLILFALCMMVPILELMLAMPLFLQLLMFASTGSLADGIVQGVLAPADRGWRSDERGPAMPTLPLSRRARAMGEALAAAPILALGGALATLVPNEFMLPGSMQHGAVLPELALVVPLILLPAVIGSSLQAGRGVLAQLLSMSLPGAAVWLAWWAGLLETPLVVPTVSIVIGALLLALGPLPRLVWPELRLRHTPAARGFGQGLLRAHLRASPMVLVALIPLALTDFGYFGPEFHLGFGIGSVALAAAFMPYGRTALGTGAGPFSPWASLPLDRHVLARRLYGHALVCLLGLPMVFVLVLTALGRLESIAVPVLATLGLAMAPVISAGLLSWWLSSWQRLALTGLAAFGLFVFTLNAVTAESLWLLVALALGSVVAGLGPVVDLLRPWQLAPVG